MGNQGKQVAVFSGVIEFAERRVSIAMSPANGVKSYPPYEVRFVDGWSYVEIDRSLHRPPTVRADVRWIAFQGIAPARGLPVPNETLGPVSPLDTMNLPLTQPMVNAHFIDAPGSDPRRVSVSFGRGAYSGYVFTYAIDPNQRIVAVSNLNHSHDDFGTTLDFVYGPHDGNIVAPSRGVQRLTPGDNLYPTPTTAQTS